MRKLLFFAAFALLSSAQAQVEPRLNYGELINPQGLRDHLSILASDALEGRETGSRGQKMAAAFIRQHFEEIGLAAPVNGEYYQTFELYAPATGPTYVQVDKERFMNLKDVAYYGDAQSQQEISSTVHFVGKGREADFAGQDVKEKAVLRIVSEANYSLFDITQLSRQKGAGLIMLVPQDESKFDDYVNQINRSVSRGSLEFRKPVYAESANGVMFIRQKVAEKIFKTPFSKLVEISNNGGEKSNVKKVKPATIRYQTLMGYRMVRTENVLGFLEGSDKKNELIVITAHYDHIGKRRTGTGDLINNGADDDASGTSAVMSMARAFAKAKADGFGPRRSILFMSVTAEENGLYGSEFYTNNPVFPLANTVVNLNIDMIGRRDAQHQQTEPYVYVIGADKLSATLHQINESQNAAYTKLLFDYTYNDEGHPERLYYRSDHWNFAKNNIPVIFYFDGIHEDYHRVSDEIGKIDFDLLTRRTHCVFNTAWEIANREQRLPLDAKKP